jgi:hypothetical protein
LIGINVEFADLQSVRVFTRDFIENRCNHFAGTAPLGPIVDQYGLIRAKYVCFETVIAGMHDVIAHEPSPELKISKFL